MTDNFDSLKTVPAKTPTLGRNAAVAILALVAVVLFSHPFRVSSLRSSAMQVRVGDSRSHVDSIMGTTHFGYSNFTRPNGQPIVHKCYGGPVHYVRGLADVLVIRLHGGFPNWYASHFRQRRGAFPVRIEYDGDDKVAKVIN